MKNKHLFFIFCLLYLLEVPNMQAQTLYLQHSFPVKDQLAVSADAQGNIFLSTPDGEILKYNAAGELLQTYSPATASRFSTLDARQGLQVMAFDENRQQLVFLDRFLNPTSRKQLPPEHFSFVSTLAWSSGNSLWAVDAGELKLKKWQTNARELILSLPLNRFKDGSFLEVKQLREHQHRLYILEEEQAYVFDQFGNFEKQLKLPSWKSAAFWQDELLLLEEDRLSTIHLYSGQEHSIPFAKKEIPYQHVLLSGGVFYLFSKQQADIYLLKP